jgi:hypothetical protein
MKTLAPLLWSAGKRSLAGSLWAVLIACIYEVFSLLFPLCGGRITHSTDILQVLDHIGVNSEPSPIAASTWAASMGSL